MPFTPRLSLTLTPIACYSLQSHANSLATQGAILKPNVQSPFTEFTDCFLFTCLMSRRHLRLLTPPLPPPPLAVRMAHEKEVTSLSNQILDAQRLRDVSDSAHGQVKVKLKVTEEHSDRLERELTETNRRLKDGTVAGGGGAGRYRAVLAWTGS